MIRAYRIESGDTFIIPSDYLFEVFSQSNEHHIFVPVKRYKKIKWYKPSSWFKEFWDIKYIEVRR